MSQHILTTELDGSPVKLVVGWDRPLKRYFFSLHDMGEADRGSMIDSSMMMSDQDDLRNVEPILERLTSLGLRLPQHMVDEVRADGVNDVGNRVERYSSVEGKERSIRPRA